MILTSVNRTISLKRETPDFADPYHYGGAICRWLLFPGRLVLLRKESCSLQGRRNNYTIPYEFCYRIVSTVLGFVVTRNLLDINSRV